MHIWYKWLSGCHGKRLCLHWWCSLWLFVFLFLPAIFKLIHWKKKILLLWPRNAKKNSSFNKLLCNLHDWWWPHISRWHELWSCLSPATVVLTGLEPNTTYEVRVAAVNGKGQGEFSHTETFQTLPIRKPDSLSFLSCSSFCETSFKLRASRLNHLNYSNSHLTYIPVWWNPVIISYCNEVTAHRLG